MPAHGNTTHPINRSFLARLGSLALPISLQSVLTASLGLIDVAMLGQLGDSAVAAAGLGTKLHFVAFLILFGLATACSVLIAQYISSGKKEHIKPTFLMTLISGMVVLIPIVLAFSVSPETGLVWLSDDPDVVALTAKYLRITAVSMLAVAIVSSVESALRAMSQAFVPLVYGTAMMLLNIVLNYVLIYGHWGAPALGVEGAAWATLSVRLIHAMALLVHLTVTKHPLALHRHDWNRIGQWRVWKTFWRFAMPLAVNFGLWGLGSTLYHLVASQMGTEALAVMSIMAPLEGLISAMFIGVSSAAAILLGEALGDNQFDRAWEMKRFFMRVIPCIGIAVGGLLWLIQPWVLAPFTELASETRVLVEQVYLLLCLLMWIKVHNLMAIVSVLRSGGDNTWCLKLDITAMWVIGLPVTVILGLVMGLAFPWVYAAMYSEEVIKLVGSRWRIAQRQWMNNLTSVVSFSS